jgi:hypothetical protein
MSSTSSSSSSSSSPSSSVRPPLMPTMIGFNQKTEQLPGFMVCRRINLKLNLQCKEQEKGK